LALTMLSNMLVYIARTFYMGTHIKFKYLPCQHPLGSCLFGLRLSVVFATLIQSGYGANQMPGTMLFAK